MPLRKRRSVRGAVREVIDFLRLCSRQQFFGDAPELVGDLGATQHPRDFVGALGRFELTNDATGRATALLLLDMKMAIRERGNLRQMRDAQYLMIFREFLQLAADDLRDLAADAGVDLVEDHRRDAAPLRLQPLEREHHTRELATRGDPRQRHRRLPEIRRQMELDGIAMGPSGIDTIEFHLSPNLGQPPMALARIASGGELSRVMLALKRLEAQRRGVATMIFDEVDAGIGGEIAQVVGRKLKELAKYHQILCVTHLPQIAAFADRHFHVEKEERRGATRSRVRQLEQTDRTDEIARMLGGAEVSDKFRRAAKELLTRAS